MGQGHKEKDILEWALDKFYAYSKSLARVEAQERIIGIYDFTASIAAAFSKNGAKDYVKEIERFME